MKAILMTLMAGVAGTAVLLAEKPVVENKEWGPACGGSNIVVTKVGGKLVSIDAYVEGSSKGVEWQCHFKDGKILTAFYRHYTMTREPADDDGQFSVTMHEDRAEVFHFPDHQIRGLEKELERELLEVLAIAMGKEQNKPASPRSPHPGIDNR